MNKFKPTVNSNEKKDNNSTNAMAHDRLRNIRIMNLERAKFKKVGFIERLQLIIHGRFDGFHGLPVKTDGIWTSPLIDKEINVYEEFSSRMFGRLQIELEDIYSHLGSLVDSISHTQNELNEAKTALYSQIDKYSSSISLRKKGEEKLTDSQIRSRRLKEREKHLFSARSRVSFLETKLSSQIDDFYRMKNRVVEDNNSTRLICNRAKDNILQKIDIYWNSAYKNHPENKDMPAVPNLVFSFNAEKVYFDLHKELMNKAESLAIKLSVVPEMEVA